MDDLDQLRKSIFFVGYEKDGAKIPIGTGFFLGVSSDSAPVPIAYLVTAKHLIGTLKKEKADKVWIRTNRRDGGHDWIASDIDDWTSDDDDPLVDVAIVPIEDTNADVHLISIAPPGARPRYRLGEEVFIIGLFAKHYGSRRNIPVVRAGNISSLPEEPLRTRDWGEVDGYLIECRSIGGLSGSPVFVRANDFVAAHGQGNRLNVIVRTFHLLGIVHGHWDISRSDLMSVQDSGAGDEPLNTGLAIVIPVEKIEQVLNTPKLAEHRRRYFERQLSKAPPRGR